MGFGRAREPPACRAASPGLVRGFSSRMATSRVAPVLQAHVAEALAPHAAVGHWLGNLWVTPCLKAKLRCAKHGARWLLLFYTWGQAGNCCSDPVPGSAPRRPEGGFRSLGPPPGRHRRLGRAGSTSLPLQPVTGCEAAAGSWEPGNHPPEDVREPAPKGRRAPGESRAWGLRPWDVAAALARSAGKSLPARGLPAVGQRGLRSSGNKTPGDEDLGSLGWRPSRTRGARGQLRSWLGAPRRWHKWQGQGWGWTKRGHKNQSKERRSERAPSTEAMQI